MTALLGWNGPFLDVAKTWADDARANPSAPKRWPLAVVACSKAKLEGTHPARTLYQGDLFGKAVAVAELLAERWIILSALHGVLMPDTPVASYDTKLTELRKPEREAWGRAATLALRELAPPGSELLVLAGQSYLQTIRPVGFTFYCPLEGLKFGEQLAALKEVARPPPSPAARELSLL